MRSVGALVLSVLLLACSSRDDAPAGADAGIDSGARRVDASGTDAGGGGVDAGAVDGGGTTDAGTTDGGVVLDGGSAPDASSGRTIVTEMCARSLGSCSNDSDCMASGCGGETCAPEDLLSTCDCVAPEATCGCVAGSCAWYR